VVDAGQFEAGRAAFLQSVLASPAIFHTPQGSRQWEADARRNIARELETFD